MLTLEQIKEYFPPELARINLKGMLVEYLQHEFMDSLFKQAGSEKLSFIGGTAIRIVYNSQRFSEDLDFDNFGLGYDEFSKLINRTCRELEGKGFVLEKRLLKKDKVFHAYIKFPSILRQYGLPAHYLEKVFISVDAENKEKSFEPSIKALNRFGVFRNIIVNPAEVLLSQKLLAVLFRKKERGRDLYDVSFLLGLAKPDFKYIKKTTRIGEQEFRQKLLQRCAKLDYKELARDVAPFLFDSRQKERVLHFYETISNLF